MTRDERGASSAEYALLMTFIVLAIITGVGAFGDALLGQFQGFWDALNFDGS